MSKKIYWLTVFAISSNYLFTAVQEQTSLARYTAEIKDVSALQKALPLETKTPSEIKLSSREEKKTMQQDPASYQTLTAWTASCFNKLPEYSSPVKEVTDTTYAATALDSTEFQRVLEAFIKLQKTKLLNNPKQWIDEKSYPQEAFFTITTSGRNQTLQATIEEKKSSLRVLQNYLKNRKAPENIKEVENVQKEIKNYEKKVAELSANLIAQEKKDPAAYLKFLKSKNYAFPFTQKLMIKPGDRVCVIGDNHGSIHSLDRGLLRLKELNYLAEDLTIKQPNFHIIFLGDLVDRGRYSSESLWIAIRLILANPTKVFWLRGNHESTSQACHDGFLGFKGDITQGELFQKFKDKGLELAHLVHLAFESLPLVLYLGVQGPTETYWIQCCHGGISNGNPGSAAEVKAFLDTKECTYQKIVREKYDHGCNWSDFCQTVKDEDVSDPKLYQNNRGLGYLATVAYAQKFLKERGLKAFFRGHQDLAFGFKMFFPSDRFIDFDLSKNPYRDIYQRVGYTNGPFYWKDVIVNPDDLNNVNGFRLSSYPPIFTLSSAPEGKGGNRLDFDCFGIFTAAATYEASRFKIYEYKLSNDRNGKFVSIEKSTDDPIAVEWKSDAKKQ